MFWIAFAAQAAATNPPPPGKVYGLVAASDYPQRALDNNEQGSVYFQVVINPDGRVDTCSILLSSGYRDLDDTTCRIVTTRARFSPAQDDNGKSIYGTYRSVINWQINSFNPPVPPPPDLELTVNQAPEGVKLPLGFEVQFVVKANGMTSHCDFSPPPAPVQQSRPPKILVDLACAAVTKPPVEPIRNHNNQPVDAYEHQTVSFTEAKAAR